MDEIKADNITILLIREENSQEFFRYFKKYGYMVNNCYKGIYYIKENVSFATQIIVIKELDKESHIRLGALSRNIKKQDMKALVWHVHKLKEKQDMEPADSVVEVSISANKR